MPIEPEKIILFIPNIETEFQMDMDVSFNYSGADFGDLSLK